MTLPVFDPGATIVAEERWHGLLWSAVPHRVIRSSADELVSYVPNGTVAVHATNRGLPCAAGLSRDQRKLLALKTREVRAGESAESPDKLHIYRPGRWTRTNLGWDADGTFLGWYVNFELPPAATSVGIVSKDLVLDIWVDPDLSWRWKDRDDYHHALADGILDPEIREQVDAETGRVLDEIGSGVGPFGTDWTPFRPEPQWEVPVLPQAYRRGGASWTIPVGRQLVPDSVDLGESPSSQ